MSFHTQISIFHFQDHQIDALLNVKGVGFGAQFEPIGTRLLGQGFGTQKRRGSGIQIEDGKWDAKQGQKVRLPMSAGNETQTQKGNTQRIQKVNFDKQET